MEDHVKTITVQYVTAVGAEICVEVTPQVAELLEQTARQIRSQRRQERRYLTYVGFIDSFADTSRIHSQQTDAANLVIQKESYAELHKAMTMLSEVQRRRLSMHYFHGMRYADIAAVEGVDYSTVRTAIHRALGTLRSILT